MNIYKLAQIVKNLAENGFDNEADEIVDAIEQTPEIQQPTQTQTETSPSVTANEIINDPDMIAELEKIVGGVLHEMLEDPNSSEATLSKLPSVFTELVSD